MPQKLNTFTPIPNYLLENLAGSSLLTEKARLFMVVLRQTVGWVEGNNRKEFDWIALSQFEEKTGMNRSNICRNLKKLVASKVLIKRGKKYGINPNCDEWLCNFHVLVAHGLPNSGSQATENSGSQATYKRKERNITKDNNYLINQLNGKERDLLEEIMMWANVQSSPPKDAAIITAKSIRNNYDLCQEAFNRHRRDTNSGYYNFTKHLKSDCNCVEDKSIDLQKMKDDLSVKLSC
jgi:phage replication O-like protein O